MLLPFSESAAEICIRSAGEFITREKLIFSPKSIENKALHDLVSYVDKEVEKQLFSGLSELLPGADFLGEESSPGFMPNPQNYCWIVDPLDGTTNFVYGIPHYAISVGLWHQSEIIWGAVLDVPAKTLYTATRGQGAFANGKPLKIQPKSSPEASLWGMGFPVNRFRHLPAYLQLVEYILLNTRGIRRLGSAALDLCYFAGGQTDGFFEIGLNPWDVAAGALIAEESGGMVRDFSGGNEYLWNQSVIATHPDLYPFFHSYILASETLWKP